MIELACVIYQSLVVVLELLYFTDKRKLSRYYMNRHNKYELFYFIHIYLPIFMTILALLTQTLM